MSPYSTKNNSSDKEKCIRSEFYNLFKNSPIPENGAFKSEPLHQQANLIKNTFIMRFIKNN